MYRDDIKLFAKNEKEPETLIHAVRIYSQDIGMEFGIGKYAMIAMKSGKRHLTEWMELPNQDKIRTLAENETYKNLGILAADTIKQVEMKHKIQKEYLRRTKKLLEIKFPMHKALHPKDDIDRLYVSRKEGGRGLASIEYGVDASIQRLEEYIQKHDGGLITDIRNDTDNTMDNTMTITRKQKWEGKQLYGRFKLLINNISHDKTWMWLRKGNFKRETESNSSSKQLSKNQSHKSENR